jgi:capsular exopolysaccharide synthesis family protein
MRKRSGDERGVDAKRTPSSSSVIPVFVQHPGETVDVKELLRTVLRNKWYVLGVTAAAVLLAALYTSRVPPTYESSATLQIETGETGPPLLRDVSPALLSAAGVSGALETEIAVLGSRQIAEAVADSLALHVQLSTPASSRSAVFRELDAPREAQPGRFRLDRRDDGSYSVHGENESGSVPTPAQIEIGERVRIGDIEFTLSPALRDHPVERIAFEVVPFQHAVASLRANLDARRLAPQIVRVDYRSDDPHLAAAVPNAAAHSFITYKARNRQVESSGAVSFLRQQVSTYEEQLRSAESLLQTYREEAQVVSPREEASEHVRRLAQLQARSDERRSERDALARLLERVHAETEQPIEGRSPYRHLASYPAFLSNRAIQDILQTLTQLENRRADLLVRQTPEHVDVRGLSERIEELEYQLFETADSYLRSLDNEMASLNASLARFGVELEAIPAREVEFARLVRQQSLLEQLYTLLQTRLKEREIQEAMEHGDVRVLDVALVPEKPIHPRVRLNLLAGAFLGLVLGVGVAFVRNSFDTRVRTRRDVDGLSAGLPIVGMIPRVRPQLQRTNGKTRPLMESGKRFLRLSPTSGPSLHLISQHDPRSPAAEAFRALRTELLLGVDDSSIVLVVTSATPGDGKSVSASNLAITLAQQGVRTLLVDADLRGGALHRVFSLAQQPGLADVLTGDPLNQAVHTLEASDFAVPLHFLGTGTLPPNPAELLGSEQLRQLLAELRTHYRVVIFDTPPLSLVTDAAVLSSIADHVILVTRLGATDRQALEMTADLLQRIGRRGGVLLNDVDAVSGYYEKSYSIESGKTPALPGHSD